MADVYDALTSERCYKKAYSHDTAIQMILNGECGAFNPLLLQCLQEAAPRLQAELSASAAADAPRNALAEAQHLSETLLEENALPGQNRILRVLSVLRAKANFFAKNAHCIQMEYNDTTGLVHFSPWAVEHMKVPAELHLPEDIDKSAFTREGIRRIQKALRATTSAHPNTELSMLLPVDGELRWHRIALRSIWSENDPPFYLGAVGQAAPVEELCDYHRELSRDVLTHAYNRSFFESHLLQPMEADGVLLLDLDHFGTINETYGRQAGDIAIRTVVGAVSACVRSSSDALVRYGDDEFLLLFHHIPAHIFAQRAEEIRASVEAIRLTDYPDLRLTVSLGGVYGTCPIEPAIVQAETLLHDAKQTRNCCLLRQYTEEK